MTDNPRDPFERFGSPLVGGNNAGELSSQIFEGQQVTIAPRIKPDDFTRHERASIAERYSDKQPSTSKRIAKIAAISALAGVAGFGIFSAVNGGGNSADEPELALVLDDTSTTSNPDYEPIDIRTELAEVDAADTPLFGTVLVSPELLQTVEDSVSNPTEVPTTIAVTSTTSAATTSTLAPTTSTSSTTTTISTPPSTTVASPDTTIAQAVKTSHPYDSLDCDSEFIVFERGWTASEVAANCGLSLATLKSYNPQISDLNNIITGVTRVYLQPNAAEQTSATSGTSKEFDCAAQVGAWVEVLPGENPTSFLTRVISGYGYSAAQVAWMLRFNLISTYNLTSGPFLAGEKRCAPTASGINVLFAEIPEL